MRSDRTAWRLLVLDWRIRQAKGRRRSTRVVLAELMPSFGMIKRPDMAPDADRWVGKRPERSERPPRPDSWGAA